MSSSRRGVKARYCAVLHERTSAKAKLRLRSKQAKLSPTYRVFGDRGQQVQEFKFLVRALHAAGIEVILDVVYIELSTQPRRSSGHFSPSDGEK